MIPNKEPEIHLDFRLLLLLAMFRGVDGSAAGCFFLVL